MEKEIEVKSNVERMELFSDNYPFNLPLRIKRFESEADYVKFIKCCEGLVRKSLEYKDWRGYIIDVLGSNFCMITYERMDEVTVDVHHHLPSLYTVIKAIVNKNLAEEKEFSTFDISLEAMELHFKNKIGFVVLLSSLHEKFHNGFLQIPKNLIKGDFLYFIREYSKFLDDDELNIINERLSIDETNCSWTKDNYNNTKVA